ncbi:BTAD domain-containing putative transcriptional regulator [Amycolatopsis sp. cmx-11-32]|uniref:BTAD domain-containing putative transcriptional regulator n=1 Tax=Amycolatopsis sp. cmx-11-32 TaxID=2785796 RepID=UPI0039E227D1
MTAHPAHRNPARPPDTHHRIRWVVAAVLRFVGRVVRGVLASVVLLTLAIGLPWALVRFVGWPLPDHLPGTDELSAVLLQPMSSGFLLDALACLAWLLWFFFTLDAFACLVEVARGAHWSELGEHNGPLRRVVAVLLGAILIAVLGRTATAAPAATTGGLTAEGRGQTVATAPAWHTPASLAGNTPASRAVGGDGQARVAPAVAAGDDTPPGMERAHLPENGVHDSLWRIADRCLGDGDRWPEIWALNAGSIQPSGRVLTNPHLIYPGDLFRLPETCSPQPDQHTEPPPPPATPPPTPPVSVSPAPPSITEDHTPASRTPATPAATSQPDSSGERVDRPGSVSWGNELFVSLGLAAAASAAFVLVRRRRNAHYRPGSGTRGDDLPVAPVVYQLRLAHLQARHHDDDLSLDTETEEPDLTAGAPVNEDDRGKRPLASRRTGSRSVRVLPPGQRQILSSRRPEATPGRRTIVAPEISLNDATAPDTEVSGAAGGQTLALDLARAQGLGLVGPGGYAAARALILTILTGGAEVTVLIPAGDLVRLLGIPVRPEDLPRTVRVVDDLTTALDLLEPAAAPEAAPPAAPQVLIASPPAGTDDRARLQGLLDNGGQAGVTAVLLGQWQPGVSAYVTSTGIISATNPGLGEPLRGTRAFTLPDTATRDLLALLRDAEPVPRQRRPEPHREAEPPSTPASTSPAHDAEPAPGTDSGDSLEITSGPVPADTQAAPTLSPEVEPEPVTKPPDAPFADSAHSHGPGAETAPIVFSIFGAPALYWRPDPAQPELLHEISDRFSRRLLELLVFLAVHPDGVSRDALVDALWREHTPQRPAGVLRTILSRIRSAIGDITAGAVSELVLVEHSQYRLDPALVEIDYRGFADAVARRRAATTDTDRLAAYEEIVTRYGGLLADGLDADWLPAAREATRRDALDAVAALARARVHTDPDYTLDLLETARAFDPHNELLYRDIMRLQHTVGRHEAISRTVTLLQTRLAEVDTTPTPETTELARRLRARHTGISDTGTTGAESDDPPHT